MRYEDIPQKFYKVAYMKEVITNRMYNTRHKELAEEYYTSRDEAANRAMYLNKVTDEPIFLTAHKFVQHIETSETTITKTLISTEHYV